MVLIGFHRFFIAPYLEAVSTTDRLGWTAPNNDDARPDRTWMLSREGAGSRAEGSARQNNKKWFFKGPYNRINTLLTPY